MAKRVMRKPRTSARVVKPRVKPVAKTAKPMPLITMAKPGEAGIDRRAVIAQLAQTPHGRLEFYTPLQAVGQTDPIWFGRLVAWNQLKGEVRDAKQALPVVSFLTGRQDAETAENALAHLALLDPRSLVKALRYAKSFKTGERTYRRFVRRYLKDQEARPSFNRVMVQHRDALKTLYGMWHVKPGEYAERILFKQDYPAGSVFAAIESLSKVTPEEAAGAIAKFKIPFLVAQSVLGKAMSAEPLVVALISAMSPAELVNNAKRFEKLITTPATRGAWDAAMKKATESKRAVSSLKATKAAEVLEDAEAQSLVAAKLRVLQEKQLEKLGGIDGDWLVLGDRSGSMATAIETARHVAAVLTRMVKGKVHLIFFDTVPEYFDATGKTYEEIQKITRGVNARGGTAIGCGVQAITDRKIHVDGIAVVSDMGENNTPYFAGAYERYAKTMGHEPTVYLYETDGDSGTNFKRSLEAASIDAQAFNLRGSTVDYYALPNLVQTMRVSRYALLDEIGETPILTLDEVLKLTKGERVVVTAAQEAVPC